MYNNNNNAFAGAGGNANAAPGTEGISTKLKKCLATLNDSSKRLQSAIVNRRPHVIWEILAEQEKMIRELEQYSYLWSQLFNAEETKNSPSVKAFKDVLRNDIKQLKQVTDSNSKLAVSFLSAIRKALQHTGTNLANKTKKQNVYGKRGRMNIKKSFIINKEG